jgi:hypothetical protein
MKYFVNSTQEQTITTDVDDILEIARQVRTEFFNDSQMQQIVFENAVKAYFAYKYHMTNNDSSVKVEL